jgi:hypothetical protein
VKTVFSQKITALSGDARLLEICVGDATAASPADRIDLLALSCFRDSYVPTPRTIVRALWDQGIEVRALARNPARDHRDRPSRYAPPAPPEGSRSSRPTGAGFCLPTRKAPGLSAPTEL